MINRILHQWLQSQLRYQAFFHLRFYNNLTSDNVVVSHVLDNHIIPDMLYFFSDRDHVMSFAETDPVIFRQRLYHCGNLFISFGNRLPVDTFQCIIKKMRLNLRLKGIKTNLLQLMLFQFYLFHQHLDFIHHRVKTNCKLGKILAHIVNIDPCSQRTCRNIIHLRYYLIKGLIHFPDQCSYNNAYYDQHYDQNQNHNNHYMES